jgi:hypothetical protein
LLDIQINAESDAGKLAASMREKRRVEAANHPYLLKVRKPQGTPEQIAAARKRLDTLVTEQLRIERMDRGLISPAMAAEIVSARLKLEELSGEVAPWRPWAPIKEVNSDAN